MENKNHWKGLDELQEDPAFIEARDKEFKDELPVEEILESSFIQKSHSRRDFLKFLGFSVTAATVAASCRIPIKKAIPYVIKPEEIVPGVANYYASTFCDGNDFCPVLVKVRDGRPIKIEPSTSRHIADNSSNRFFFGGTSARAQASVLSLYDTTRPKNPTVSGHPVTKQNLAGTDAEVRTKLQDLKNANGNIRILTPTIMSPSTKAVIADFITMYPSTKHIAYDPISYAGIAIAHEKAFGKRVIPGYHFENANVIVSIGADFLGTWISPVEFARQYVQNRKVSAKKTEMSKHYQIESRLSLTGSNADKRAVVKPSEEAVAVLALYNKLSGNSSGSNLNARADQLLTQAANDLLANKGKSLVISSSNDSNVQSVVAAINNMLGNYGSTINLNLYSNTHQSSDKDVASLFEEMNSGSVSALIVYGANPVYDHWNGKGFAEAMKKVQTTISLNDRADETSAECKYHFPDHHYLESWNDFSPRNGLYTMCQPTIWPLYQTRQAQETLLRWMGKTDDYVTYIENNWKQNVYPRQTMYGDFQTFWDNCVKEGAVEITSAEEPASGSTGDVTSAVAAVSQLAGKSGGMEVSLYEKIGAGNGRYANVPWLQEMPDPVSKVVWDNYVAVSPKFAKDNHLEMNVVEHWSDVVNVKVGNISVELPIYVQPGQNDTSVSIALGYGREKAGRSGNKIGTNVFPLLMSNGETTLYYNAAVSITKANKHYPMAITQTHFSFEGRDAIIETTLGNYKKNPNEDVENKEELKKLWAQTLYPTQDFPAIKWGMSIDLNSCIGCGACAVSCQAENNVPVVGKTEVRRVHEMSWLRIDRYFSFPSDNGMLTKENDIHIDNISKSKVPDFQDVQVVFQPMLCQHCENAPCENVCPVSATNHSSEGLNQMAYNRCIGTRYCANNCPYKVRRFNWLDYTTADVFPWNEPWKIPGMNLENPGMTDAVTRMVLNPDVTVRSRGVMEKCSFCVQRLQESKLTAKKEGRPLKDGDTRTACQTACPTEAIQFGNVLEENSVVRNDHDDARGYYVLSELNTRPSIVYMKKVRNTDEKVATYVNREAKES
ncbi:MAG TPA: TAT-variant-translocated molybdopterin oxidoreductase [Chitinophagales bacterium]|nr:TAT-variant-translocated molybdopterin oxidoreductase [Chitinophagales bacterium]